MKKWTRLFLSKVLNYLMLLPLIGILLFLVFYVLAAIKYPGGSWADPTNTGFSFLNNYLCDLLDDIAINGEFNHAKYFARISLAVLCSSILIIWTYLPKLSERNSVHLRITLFTGYMALITTFFLAAGTHDIIVRIAGIFGVIALVCCYMELFKLGYFNLLFYGVVCLMVFLINYYIYETEIFIKWLPIIQKITFLLFVGWFILLDITIYKKLKKI